MRKLLFAFALLCLALPAAAQDDKPDPTKDARIKVGPLAMNPTIGITNVGVDTNVFNEWYNPKSDFTATLTPGADIWFRAGRTLLTSKVNAGYVYFQQFAQERSLNADLRGRWEIDLFHVRPYIIGSYLNTRDRPGFEIDVRARRFEDVVGFGADFPLTKRVTFGVQARRLDVAYAADEIYLGSYLNNTLNRREDIVEASFRYKLTPLTTLVVKGDAQQARFTYSPLRNSDGVRITPGVEFDAFAIIQGSAFVGMRKLDMLGPLMPDYKGVVASVDLGYTLYGRTRFSVQVARDVYYSYEQRWPYYVQTGATLTITERIAGPFDAQGRYGRQNLDYPDTWLAGDIGARRDAVTFFGGGAGYHIGETARLGFNIDSYQRESPLYTRKYQGLRIGTSLTYGF